MSRRKVVNLNLEVLLPMIKKVCRSNVVFCEEMGRPKQKTWVTGWSNKPNPKNLPSPEEAARMCILLETTPEKILLHEGKNKTETDKYQEDIKLVRELIEREMEMKRAPAQMDEGEEEFTKLFRQLPPEVQERELAYLRQLAARAANQDK